MVGLITLALVSFSAEGAHAGCDASAHVVINEVVSNPDGSDSSALREWVELYNSGPSSVDLSEWVLERAKSSWDDRYTIPKGTLFPSETFIVIGESKVGGADLISASALDLGNASSSSDAIRIVDCFGSIVDTIIYGANNTDGFTEDSGSVAKKPVESPGSDESVGRSGDGIDSNDSGTDFKVFEFPTMGASNATKPTDCGGPKSGVVINEFLSNPAGSDSSAGTEFFELYNGGMKTVDLEEWSVVTATSNSSETTQYIFEGGATIAVGEHILVGDFAVGGAIYTSLNLPNGTDGDAIRLLDCGGFVADSVIYGSNNDDEHVDDLGNITSSVAPKPGDDEAIARISDGYDTDHSGDDFIATTDATPGDPNLEVEPIICVPSDGSITINEFMADVSGSDTGYEWVELYNSGAITTSVEGWGIAFATQADSYDPDVTLPTGAEVPAMGWLVIGGEKVVDADYTGSFSIGGGTDGDGIQVLDCEGDRVDTVVYGGSNEDMLTDDSDNVANSIAESTSTDVSIGRIEDGVDTDASGDDFARLSSPTPGASNLSGGSTEDCIPSSGGVVINEIYSNPEGSDGGYEWVELYNSSGSRVDLGGWGLAFATSASQIDDTDVEIIKGVTIGAGKWLLVGGEKVAGADVIGDLSIGNGTDGDGARLIDCSGNTVDTVVYGSNNDDLIPDDTEAVATSLAEVPGEAESIGRVTDGYDTDLCGQDFAVSDTPTPGSANPVFEPVVCVPAGVSSVVLNELLPNPDSTDGGFEWVELFNPTSEAIPVDGWGIIFATQSDDFDTDSFDIEIPGGIEIASGDFLVIGGEFIENADIYANFSIPNGSGGDGARLFDCDGNSIDTVVYGDDNEDLIIDDNGEIIERPVSEPSEMMSIARVDDGIDADLVEDWFIDISPTPGATNYQEEITVDDDKSTGCGGNAPDSGEPSGCGRTSVDNSGSGCTTMPLPLGGLELFPLGVAVLRRRRIQR